LLSGPRDSGVFFAARFPDWNFRQAAGASSTGIAKLRFLETAQSGGRGLAADLSGQLGPVPFQGELFQPQYSRRGRMIPVPAPFFAYPADIRKVIYTTNAVESLNMSLRKVIKTRGSFPNAEAAMKLLYLALEHIAKKWTMPVQNWKAALQRFVILFGDRVPKAELM
jgi:hypothetical protein